MIDVPVLKLYSAINEDLRKDTYEILKAVSFDVTVENI